MNPQHPPGDAGLCLPLPSRQITVKTPLFLTCEGEPHLPERKGKAAGFWHSFILIKSCRYSQGARRAEQHTGDSIFLV